MSDRGSAVPSVDQDGVPQPASAPMTREAALALQARTGGQLAAYQHADGDWYVYATQPASRLVVPAR